MSTTSIRLTLPFIDAQQASQDVTHNEALILLDALLGLSVPSVAAPSNTPGTATNGLAYITGSAATGAWSGHNSVIAYYMNAWYFITPVAGLLAHGVDTGLIYRYSGSAWVTLAGQVEAVQTLTDGASISWDTAVSATAKLTIGGNRTMAAPSNLKAGASYLLAVTQDGTGSRTLAYNGVFKWVGGVAPILSTAAGAKDLLSFYSPDGTNLYGAIQKAFA